MVAVYLFSFIGSGSHIVIIPLTDDTCVYMFPYIGSGSYIVIIPPTDDSGVYMFSFYRKWLSYYYHSPQ
jgi:hypothetical protein